MTSCRANEVYRYLDKDGDGLLPLEKFTALNYASLSGIAHACQAHRELDIFSGSVKRWRKDSSCDRADDHM